MDRVCLPRLASELKRTCLLFYIAITYVTSSSLSLLSSGVARLPKCQTSVVFVSSKVFSRLITLLRPSLRGVVQRRGLQEVPASAVVVVVGGRRNEKTSPCIRRSLRFVRGIFLGTDTWYDLVRLDLFCHSFSV